MTTTAPSNPIAELVEPVEKPIMFVIWSNEHSAWWKPNESSYTCWLHEAGLYRIAETIRILDTANSYLMPESPRNELAIPVRYHHGRRYLVLNNIPTAVTPATVSTAHDGRPDDIPTGDNA